MKSSNSISKSKQLFSVEYGFENRDKFIRNMQETDPSIAMILASVHFEWVIKRSILMLGRSPTKNLRNKLSTTFVLSSTDNKKVTYKSLWKEEVEFGKRHTSLGKIVTKINFLESVALKARGEIIHGNGTIGKIRLFEATQLFLDSAAQLFLYVKKNNYSLNERLRPRIAIKKLK